MKKVLKKVAASGAMTALAATGLIAATAQPAAACPAGSFYALTSSRVRIPFAGVPKFHNGPGGTMTVSRQYSGTASYQVTVGSTAEVNGVFASARVEVSGSITKANTTSATNTHTWNVTRGRYGNARYDSIGYRVNYKKQQFINSCRSIVTVAQGTINFPADTEGWYYWETAT